MNWLVIVAGGSGNRMNLSINKIFIKIYRKPILYWTLLPFQNSPTINKIIISSKPEELKSIQKIVKKYQFTKVSGFSFAGPTRQDTVFNALNYIKKEISSNDLVGIHNAANPFVSDQEINSVFINAKKYQAALLAKPSSDTIKISNNKNFVNQTPNREFCFCAQTPQVARFDLLFSSYQKIFDQQLTITDDSQVLELNGIKPKIIPCSPQNIKITYPQDIFLAKQILKIKYNL